MANWPLYLCGELVKAEVCYTNFKTKAENTAVKVRIKF
jgi:hypothetical protein